MNDYKPKRIRVYRNGDTYHTGRKLVVNRHIYRNFEQFLFHLTDEVNLVSGAVRKLYELETGGLVHNLDNLKDGTSYVATGGESLKRIEYLANEDPVAPYNTRPTSSMMASKSVSSESKTRRIINRSTGGLLQETETPPLHAEPQIFSPISKAYKIIVFENGEAFSPGLRMILNYRNCKSFEQVLRHLSTKMVLTAGQVRKLYDAESGKRIRSLNEIRPGHNLVAAAFEPFKKVQYLKQDLSTPAPVIKHETQLHPRIVTFYPNGDSYHTGLTLTISNKRFPTLSRLMDTLNHQIELVTGKIQKIYSLKGVRLQKTQEFETGLGYVLVANDDPFINTRYNVMALKHQDGPVGLGGFTKHNEFMKKIRPVTTMRHIRPHHTETVPNQTDKIKQQHHASVQQKRQKPTTKTSIERLHTPAKEIGIIELIEKEVETIISGSRPHTQSRLQKNKSADAIHEDEIFEDEKIRSAKATEEEVYGGHELKKLEGLNKSVRINSKGSTQRVNVISPHVTYEKHDNPIEHYDHQTEPMDDKSHVEHLENVKDEDSTKQHEHISQNDSQDRVPLGKDHAEQHEHINQNDSQDQAPRDEDSKQVEYEKSNAQIHSKQQSSHSLVKSQSLVKKSTPDIERHKSQSFEQHESQTLKQANMQSLTNLSQNQLSKTSSQDILRAKSYQTLQKSHTSTNDLKQTEPRRPATVDATSGLASNTTSKTDISGSKKASRVHVEQV
ncbi:hypothetical protein MT418_002890 [Batrachochytrium dendrobatidis]